MRFCVVCVSSYKIGRCEKDGALWKGWGLYRERVWAELLGMHFRYLRSSFILWWLHSEGTFHIRDELLLSAVVKVGHAHDHLICRSRISCLSILLRIWIQRSASRSRSHDGSTWSSRSSELARDRSKKYCKTLVNLIVLRQKLILFIR